MATLEGYRSLSERLGQGLLDAFQACQSSRIEGVKHRPSSKHASPRALRVWRTDHLPSMPILAHLGYEGQTIFQACQSSHIEGVKDRPSSKHASPWAFRVWRTDHLPSMPIRGHLGYEGQTFFHWAQRYVPDLLMILSKILTGIKSGAPSRPLGRRAWHFCLVRMHLQCRKPKPKHHHNTTSRNGKRTTHFPLYPERRTAYADAELGWGTHWVGQAEPHTKTPEQWGHKIKRWLAR